MPSQASSAESSLSEAAQSWVVAAFAPDDLFWFEWLCNLLKDYRVPSALVGQPSRHGGPLPEQFSVYPDPLDPFNYWRYPETLATARCFVVVCSRNSVSSTWIDQQLIAFSQDREA